MELEKYLNQKYKFNGRGKEGYDCLGLVFSILNENNIAIPISDGHKIEKDWMNKQPLRLLNHFKNHGKQIETKNRKELDVAVFEINNILRHAGVIIDNYRFIHIFDNSRARISQFSKWEKKLHSIWRVR